MTTLEKQQQQQLQQKNMLKRLKRYREQPQDGCQI